nr:hypothetical protein [Pseudomonas viridiflava]
MSRYDGQLLYMLIAKTGTIFFAVACLTSFWLMYVSKDGSLATTLGERSDYIKFIKDFLITNEIANNAEAPIWAFLAQASVISLILSWLSPRFFMLLLMLRHWASLQAIKGLILASKVPTRPLTKQLLTSMRDSKNLYMFSMADRKVYVGRVAHIGDLHEAGGMDEDFEIVPTMSGYRDKDTLKVTYTTDYSAVVDEMVRTGRKVGFSIVLSQKNIVSMSRYEDEIWNRFKLRQDVAENAKEGMLVRLAKLLEKL